jgi:uncharacterized membrane protein
MAGLYIVAGSYHFISPEFYKKIMPPWLPWHYLLIYISGICEIIFGILLTLKTTRRLAAWGIILLLIAVFPANIQMMLNYRHAHDPNLWIAILRLPFQPLLIWWAWQFAKKE